MEILTSVITVYLDLIFDYPAFSVPFILFLILAFYWHETGRFPIIGFIVRLVYLPFNVIFAFLWIIGVFLSGILRVMDVFHNLKPAILFFVLILALNDQRFFILLAVLFLLFWQGVDTERLRYAMNHYPRAKRKPAPRERAVKPKPPRKVAPPQLRPESRAAAPPPIVSIAATAEGNPYTEKQLVQLLPPNLQKLIAGESEATPRPRPPVLKPFLRVLLKLFLFPVTVLMFLFKRKPKPAPEPLAENPEPLTSEASSNE